MKKEEYIKPEMKVCQMEAQAILAASNETLNIATKDDYDNLDDLINPDGSIDAD